MSLLEKFENTDRMLSKRIRDLTKSLKYEDDEEDEEEEKKKARKKHNEDEEEVKSRKKKIDDEDEEDEEVEEEEEEEEEEYKSRRTRKGKKDVEDFIEEDVDVEDEFPYEEPEDEEDEEAEEEVAERQNKIARRSYRKNRRKDDDIEDMIEEDQEDVYFDDEDDDDLPGEEFEIPEEQGHEEGIITNYGRRIRKKVRKSFYEDTMSDLVEVVADLTLLTEANLKLSRKIAEAVAVMMKSQQKINADMELIKSQAPTYPMAPFTYIPTVNTRKTNSGKEYSEEQVREALVKGMTSGKISGDLLRDFEAWMSKPGARVTDWVNDMLDEPLKKTLGL